MKEILMFLIGALADNPESIKIGVSEQGDIMRFKLSMSSSDRGKIIGKEGRVIKSIRTILQAAAAKQDKRVYLDID